VPELHPPVAGADAGDFLVEMNFLIAGTGVEGITTGAASDDHPPVAVGYAEGFGLTATGLG